MEFPKTIFVKIENDDDEEYLIASENPEGISEQDSEIVAAKYTLEKEVNIINTTTIENRQS